MNDNFDDFLRSELAAAVAGYTPPPGLRTTVDRRRVARQRRARVGMAAATAALITGVAAVAIELEPGLHESVATGSPDETCDTPRIPDLPHDPASMGGDLADHEWTVEVETTSQGPTSAVFIDGAFIGGMSRPGEIAGHPQAALGLTVAPGIVVADAWMPTSVAAIRFLTAAGDTFTVCPFASAIGAARGDRATDFPAHWFATTFDTMPVSASFLDTNGTIITHTELSNPPKHGATPGGSDIPSWGGRYNVDIPFTR